eukprot:4696931-Amphidinium_carterae.2
MDHNVRREALHMPALEMHGSEPAQRLEALVAQLACPPSRMRFVVVVAVLVVMTASRKCPDFVQEKSVIGVGSNSATTANEGEVRRYCERDSVDHLGCDSLTDWMN